MKISKIYIKNFRGLDLEISDLQDNFIIIGKNDSGKSNFCYAIRKVLDINTRRIPLNEADSSNSNKEEIIIRITLDINNISSNNRALLKNLIDQDEKTKEETVTVELNAQFNINSNAYNEIITFGTLDKSNTFPTNNTNRLDEVLDLIYVYPNYDLLRDTNVYFKFHKSENLKNDINVSKNIVSSINKLNTDIASENVVNTMVQEINQFNGMKDIFKDMNIKITSNIDVSDIYKSLKLYPTLENLDINNIGDGKSKILALLLQKLSQKASKEKIIILEEPENHLYPLLQKIYASIIDDFKFGQAIFTTHSPNIVDFKKTKEILKFSYVKDKNNHKMFKFNRVNNEDGNIYKEFGYLLNEEIAEAFFYDEVLLVEGYSEKIFYNILTNTDEQFRDLLLKRNFGFLCIYGIDFKPVKTVLTKLGLIVHVLTDNDIFSIPYYRNKNRYSGLQRGFSLLDKEEINILEEMGIKINPNMFTVEKNSSEEKYIISEMNNYICYLKEFNIYIQDNIYGFEGSFLDFIGSKNKNVDIKYLNKMKMKNLHYYLLNKNIKLCVTDVNKSNILVGFLYENI